MSNDIITLDRYQDAANLMPAMRMDQARERRNQMVEFVRELMVGDVDYGAIPGSTKPTLLKPGAERLKTFFGLVNRYVTEEREEDWTGERHGGEPFFYYLEKCQLFRGDAFIGEASGSCNSWESKYRYRKAERVCPTCGQAAIVRGKAEYGGGWLCFAKRGGCGAKFGADDPAITAQQVGRVLNADVADQVNTVKKIAQKRALVAAVLIAVNASEFFTQDMEDLHDPVPVAPVAPPVDRETGEIREPAPVIDRSQLWALYSKWVDKAKEANVVYQELPGNITDENLKLAIKALRDRVKGVAEAAELVRDLHT